MVLEEQIIIGTPGTTLDWCFKQRVLDLTKISLFVLDEADIMIDTQGLSCQSIRIHRWGLLRAALLIPCLPFSSLALKESVTKEL